MATSSGRSTRSSTRSQRTCTARDLAELGRHPWIESVSIDAVVHAGAAPGRGAGSGPESSLREILGLPAIAESHGPTGSTVRVAIVDSGIAPTVDLASRIAGFYDFTKGGIPAPPSDAYGHGTHVAGLIGGGGSQAGKQFQGIAPDVRFVGFKVLDKSGTGHTSDVIKAIEYIVANHAALKVQIINLSLGHPIYESAKTDPLVRVVEKAAEAGLIVVASAGNYGENDNDRQGWLHGSYVAWQRALRHHRRCDGDQQHDHPCGRRRGAVQLARADVVRRVRETRRRRAGPPSRVGNRRQLDVVQAAGVQPQDRERAVVPGVERLEHGGGGHDRRCRADRRRT